MIVLSNTVAQTLLPGQSITFDRVILHTGCAECHRGGTSSVKLRANGIYRVSFHGNIGGGTAATAVQLVIETGGEPLSETTMISVPVAATTEFNNVGTSTLLRNCCGDYDRVTVTNNGTTNVLIAPNTVLHIERVA